MLNFVNFSQKHFLQVHLLTMLPNKLERSLGQGGLDIKILKILKKVLDIFCEMNRLIVFAIERS